MPEGPVAPAAMPTAAMIDLYVYYKVRAQDAAALAPRIQALQADLAQRWQLTAERLPQLKRRPGTPDGVQTWMEVYPASSDAFGAALAEAVQAAALDTLIDGPRRTEVFMDLTPCA